MWCVETPMYTCLNVLVGQSVELLCNASLTDDIMWTYDNNTSHVDHVYLHYHIQKAGLSVKSAANGSHSLVIAEAKLNDSGLYNCYDGGRLRKAGYHLNVTGTIYACNRDTTGIIVVNVS